MIKGAYLDFLQKVTKGTSKRMRSTTQHLVEWCVKEELAPILNDKVGAMPYPLEIK